jgi:hypothetical protein
MSGGGVRRRTLTRALVHGLGCGAHLPVAREAAKRAGAAAVTETRRSEQGASVHELDNKRHWSEAHLLAQLLSGFTTTKQRRRREVDGGGGS